MTNNPLFEKIRKSLSKINCRKLGIIVFYCALGLFGVVATFLLIGVLVVGRPSAPAHEENPINVLITLGIFLGAGITIYTFRGGGGKKR